MKILFLTTLLPSNESNGSEIASNSYIKSFISLGVDIKVIGYKNKFHKYRLDFNEYEQAVSEIRVETYLASILTKFIWLIKSLLLNIPFASSKYYTLKYIGAVKKELGTGKAYDYVVIDHAQLGWLIRFIKGYNIIFISHNIEHELYHNLSDKKAIERFLFKREAKLVKAMEDSLAVSSFRTWTISKNDQKYFSKVSPNPEKIQLIEILPAQEFTSYKGKETVNVEELRILGMWTWEPNRKGLEWFFEYVFPKLDKDIKINVGGIGGEWINKLNLPNVVYSGFVDSAVKFLGAAKLLAIPSTQGSGLQIKTINAICLGKPLVATSFALRSIDDFPKYVYKADDVDTFAEYINNMWSLEDAQKSVSTEMKNWIAEKQERVNSSLKKSIGI